MELLREKGLCCGCRTCEHVCPQSAITMEDDGRGFLYPRIDQEKCVDCGLCLKKCAFQNGYASRKEFEPSRGFAARHRDLPTMMKSRSGGAFTALSDRVLEMGGVVFGAGYDDGEGFFRVLHKCASTKEERDEFRGSKYVQSDLGDVFPRVKEELEAGRTVLFSGLGCQVGALYSYLGREYDNLVTADIVCYGVPSPRLWRDFLRMREREKGGRVTAVDFRDKEKFGWKAHKETITVGGRKVSSRLYKKLFSMRVATRPSCFQCIYANKDRVGDITLADFWGHEDAVPGFGGDDRGVSLVLVNTKRGEELWERARKDMDVIECTGYPYRHTMMKRPNARPENYEEFWADYDADGFDFVARKYCDYEVKAPKEEHKKRPAETKPSGLAGKLKKNVKRFLGKA